MYLGAFLVAQKVKNLPAIQETQVWFLGQEDPLEKVMATHSRIQHVFSIPKFRPLEIFGTEVWLFPCVNMIKNSLNSACLLVLVV